MYNDMLGRLEPPSSLVWRATMCHALLNKIHCRRSKKQEKNPVAYLKHNGYKKENCVKFTSMFLFKFPHKRASFSHKYIRTHLLIHISIDKGKEQQAQAHVHLQHKKLPTLQCMQERPRPNEQERS
jgi:hypothetical protein